MATTQRNSLRGIFQRPAPSNGNQITSDDTNAMKPITYQSRKSFSPRYSTPFPGFLPLMVLPALCLHPVNFRSKPLFQRDISPAAQRKLIDYLPIGLAQ